MTDDEFRASIYAAFGMTPEDVAEFESSPEHQSYLAARAEAQADEEAFRAWLGAHAQRITDELTGGLGGRVVYEEAPVLTLAPPWCGGKGAPVRGCGCSFCKLLRPLAVTHDLSATVRPML